MRRAAFLPAALSVLAAACVSLPRDTGTDEVRAAVSQRTAQRVTAEVVRFAADVRAQHAELLAASQRVAQARANLEAAKASAELAQHQHDAQNNTDLDLENEQAQYEQAKLDLAREERRLLVA